MLPVNPHKIGNLEILIEYVQTPIVLRFMEIITKQDLVGLKLKDLMGHIVEGTKIIIITLETTRLVFIRIMALAKLALGQVI